MAAEATLIVNRGWDDLADAASFYPPDLPGAWRLTYFANEYGAVLLPWHAWRERSPIELAAWQADVQPGFRFFLGCPVTNPAGPNGADSTGASPTGAEPTGAGPPFDATLATARAALGATLGGWVIGDPDETFEAGSPGGSAADSGSIGLRTFPCVLPTTGAPGRTASSTVAVVAPAAVHWPPRAARDWLQALPRPPRLVILPNPNSTDLTAWGHLLALLGWR